MFNSILDLKICFISLDFEKCAKWIIINDWLSGSELWTLACIQHVLYENGED